jgi:hypothetical protein
MIAGSREANGLAIGRVYAAEYHGLNSHRSNLELPGALH